ncbi:hypothetical protein JCM11251_002069 [Rhodosporidiobolus azoricus]
MPPHQPGSASTADKNTSVRARSKPATAQEQHRKTVYRTVLDNPLTLQWPPLPAATRKAILDELIKLIEASSTPNGKSVADWRLDEHANRSGRTRGAGKGKAKAKKQDEDAAPKIVASFAGSSSSTSPSALPTSTLPEGSTSSALSSQKVTRPPPELLSHMVVGINEVTRCLESQIRWGRWELGDRSAAPSPVASTSAAVPDGAAKGRHRRRKPSSSSAGPAVLPSSSSRLDAALALAEHPAHAFAQRRPPAPTMHDLPPYLVDSGGGGVRMLVNSEGRRLKAEPVARDAKEANLAKVAKSASGVLTEANNAYQTGYTLLPTAANQPPASTSTSATSHFQAPPTIPLVDLIFVCKPDINPPSLVAHLPGMVAAANGVGEALSALLAAEEGREEKEGGIKAEKMQVDDAKQGGDAGGRKRPPTRTVLLVPLDVGAEARLGDALALRRVAAIGVSSSAPGASSLLSLLKSVSALNTPLRAPWLVPHLLHPLPPSKSAKPSAAAIYVPTTIKHLRTSAPLNPKAASVEKKRKRREKKEVEKEEKRKKRKLAEGQAEAEEGVVYMAED